MIIGIDGNEANVINRVGIGEYAFELLQQFSNFLAKPDPASQDKFQNLKFTIYLKNTPLLDMPIEGENWSYRILKPGRFWTQWRLPLDLYLRKSRPDIFFSPSHYAPRFCPVPSVISVMDLSYMHFPDLFNKKDLRQLRNWTAYSVKNAKKIVTISKSSKNDIIKSYKISADKIIVTHLGIKQSRSLAPQIYAMNQIKTKYDISDSYILFVGTLQPRKNIERLIEAFSLMLSSDGLNAQLRNSMQLVIVGKKGWLYEEILKAPKKFGIEKKVKFLEQVDNDELSNLYKNAMCFILPSLYEGFGLPVLEAMQAGCPVITSNVSSLPEAGGDACLYVDPEDTGDIVEKMLEMVTNKKLRQELIEKGKQQVHKFSWENTAHETLSVLESVVKNKII